LLRQKKGKKAGVNRIRKEGGNSRRRPIPLSSNGGSSFYVLEKKKGWGTQPTCRWSPRGAGRALLGPGGGRRLDSSISGKTGGVFSQKKGGGFDLRSGKEERPSTDKSRRGKKRPVFVKKSGTSAGLKRDVGFGKREKKK